MKVLLQKLGAAGAAPGDIMVLTAAVESLSIERPDYEISVQTRCHELWAGNHTVRSYHGPLEDVARGFDVVAEVHYDHLHGSQERLGRATAEMAEIHSPGCNFVQAFTWGIGRALDENIRVRRQTPVAFLTREDSNWLGEFRKEHGDGPFVLLSPSVKRDVTIKAWPVEYYQALVDHFGDRAKFIQIGDPSCMGCKLDGVIDMVSKTTLRQVLALAYKAKAAVGPVTYLLHACAAFGTPYFCLAGGREQPSWITYPNVQYFHTMGELSCCRKIACWKQRVIALPPLPYSQGMQADRADHEQNQRLCDYPILTMERPVAQCMADITPDQVIAVMERHARGWVRKRKIAPRARPKQAKEEGWAGVGDMIAAGTKAIGIEPCDGCEDRRQLLNRWLPFRNPFKLKRKPPRVRKYLQRRNGVLIRKRMPWDDAIADEKRNDEFELQELPEMRRIVDVGAHIGTFALQCLRLWEHAELACVEPSLRNVPLLALNVKDLPATIFPAAMCYQDKPLLHNSVRYGRGHSGGSSICPETKVSNDPYALVSEVPSITLEGVMDVMGWDEIDLLKLDCEGSEFDILKHADLSRVRYIVGEWHNPSLFAESVRGLDGWKVRILRNAGIGLFQMFKGNG